MEKNNIIKHKSGNQTMFRLAVKALLALMVQPRSKLSGKALLFGCLVGLIVGSKLALSTQILSGHLYSSWFSSL